MSFGFARGAYVPDDKVSGAQVSGWANEIEASVGAAFDDKPITLAASQLIRYGKVAPDSLKKAMQVMTDLAPATGGVETASRQLSKALADPTIVKSIGRTS